MIKAVIFDMDWLLIDSEPIWKESEQISFQTVWINLNDSMMSETTWLRVDEVVDYWHKKYPWDISKCSKQELSELIVYKVKELIKDKWKAKKWVHEILDFLSKKVKYISLASSSEYSIINQVIDKLWIRKHFSFIYSAQDEAYWKPHPWVYISTCKKMNIDPMECIAFEDSLNWVLSAKSAKIRCIAVPEETNRNNPKYVIADIILNSLDKFDQFMWEDLNK